MLEYIPLNFAIMKQPMNWVIVLLMVIIAGFMLDIILAYLRQQDTNA